MRIGLLEIAETGTANCYSEHLWTSDFIGQAGRVTFTSLTSKSCP